MESGTTINRGNENLFDDASFFPFPFLHHQIRFHGPEIERETAVERSFVWKNPCLLTVPS